jgi:hypothetical protein
MGRLFEPLRQFLVARSYSEHPFPSARVIEGFGSGEDFLGRSRRSLASARSLGSDIGQHSPLWA